MKGRKPIPTSTKIARGNPGHRPLPLGEPQPKAAGLGTPPSWLGPHGRKEWRRLAAALPAGQISVLDLNVLEVYCAVFEEWRSALDQVKKEGPVCMTKDGQPRTSPHQVRLRNARQDLLRLAVELGFTPSARTRVPIRPDDQEDDPITRIIEMKIQKREISA